MEALTPPAQLSEWHLLNIESSRTIQAVIDLRPKDDVIGFANFLLIAVASAVLEESLSEVAARLPEDVRQQMIEAGCIDPEDVPDDDEEVPDDHGNDIDDATVAAVGADVEGALDYDDDIDYFRFQAEQGESYQIDVALGTLDDSIVDLYDVDWSFLDSNDDYGDTYASRLYWEAPSSGERYVLVGGYRTGTYTLTVSIVDDHGDTAADGVGVASDRAALVALYNATEGGSWITRTNWLSGRPLDEWHGVTTDSGGRVTALNLSSNSLKGALPAALGDLTNLESLRLSDNSLTGPIPAELGDLTNLRALNLGSEGRGKLTGPIPAALGNLTNLESLDLSSNDLTGSIPAWLGDLSNLRALNLWSNELTGRIPAALGNLTNLESLWLGWNELTGPIPAWLGDLSNLVVLLLPVNQLTGPIPAELGDLSNLKVLNLWGNSLTGPIPAALGDLANLEILNLGGANQLTGRIPAELGDLSNLKELDLWGNSLTGPIPAALGDLANLEILNLGSNELTGWIPAALGDLTNLESLWLRSNQLTGRIPAALSNLSNLSELYLLGNDLTGCVPVGLRNVAEEDDLGKLPDCDLEGRPTASSLDDHGNSKRSATYLSDAAWEGEDVRGALDYDGDIDYFSMIAKSGRTYQIDVTLGTLDNSIVKLYDEDGALLDSNDDYGGTLASRLYWEARSVNDYEHYIAVEGHGMGTYTLTVSIVDDHGDDFESATRIAVGESVRMLLHYYDDRDVLVFRARPNTEYVLALDYHTGQRRGDAAGTTMALHDAGGQVLARLKNYDFDSSGSRNKIMWQAATGDDLYIVVGNEDAFGIFALTVTVR